MYSSKVISGILEDAIYCHECNSFEQRVYMVIYHLVLVDVCVSEAEAHQKLHEMNRDALISLYNDLQQRMQGWKTKYERLYSLIESYRSYLREGQTSSADLRNCLQAKQVLACLLEKVRQAPKQVNGQAGSLDLDNTLDKADILDLYYRSYKEMESWRGKYSSLFNMINSYQKYLCMTEEERAERRASVFGAFAFHEIENCLGKEDVLGCLLKDAEKGRGWPFFEEDDID
jgi:hypothetical protein